MNKLLFVCVIASSMLFSGCSGDEVASVQNDDLQLEIVEKTDPLISELSDFIDYSFDGLYQFYNPSTKDYDRNAFGDYIKQYEKADVLNISLSTKSESEADPFSIDGHINVLGIINDKLNSLQSPLSENATQLLLGFASKEIIDFTNFESFRSEVSKLDGNDQIVLERLCKVSELVAYKIQSMGVHTKGGSLACDVAFLVGMLCSEYLVDSISFGPYAFYICAGCAIGGTLVSEYLC